MSHVLFCVLKFFQTRSGHFQLRGSSYIGELWWCWVSFHVKFFVNPSFGAKTHTSEVISCQMMDLTVFKTNSSSFGKKYRGIKCSHYFAVMSAVMTLIHFPVCKSSLIPFSLVVLFFVHKHMLYTYKRILFCVVCFMVTGKVMNVSDLILHFPG